MVIVRLTRGNEGASAVTVIVRVPSRRGLSVAAMEKAFWVWPARSVTVEGISNSSSVLVIVTRRSVGRVPVVLIDPALTLPSTRVAGRVKVKTRASLSTAVVLTEVGMIEGEVA